MRTHIGSAILHIILFFLCVFILPNNLFATNYYISPNASSTGVGSSASPWKSFSKAWAALMPGDTLYLYDGRYTDGTTGLIQPDVRNGQQGSPITIKAVNDGKAIIDGEGKYIPVRIGENWGNNGPIGNWYVLEGIVGINGTISSIRTEKAEHVILRRVSGYNADINDNSFAIGVVWSNDVLLEDCIAAGSGRYMINVIGNVIDNKLWGENNTVRRCFTLWRQWDGRKFCGVAWPNGNHIGLYNVSRSSIENSISVGRAESGMFTQANDVNASAVGNKILGSISILQGREMDSTLGGKVWNYNTYPIRPSPAIDPYTGNNCNDNVAQLPDGSWGTGWIALREGFNVWGQGTVKGNVFRDLFAFANSGVGVGMAGGAQSSDTIFDHITSVNNGAEARGDEKEDSGGNTDMINMNTFTNSYIGTTNQKGEGARLQNRYENGNLTNTSLWPWTMEERAKSELASYIGIQNYSINSQICQKYLSNATVASHGYNMNVNCGTNGPVPTVVYATNTPAPSSNQPCPLTGDTNICDGKVDVLDFNYLSSKFNTNDSKADLDRSGKVNVLDYTILSNNFGRRL